MTLIIMLYDAMGGRGNQEGRGNQLCQRYEGQLIFMAVPTGPPSKPLPRICRTISFKSPFLTAKLEM